MTPFPDDAILALLYQRPQATAAAIGAACRMTPGEVRTRLAGLESQRLAPDAARAGVQGDG